MLYGYKTRTTVPNRNILFLILWGNLYFSLVIPFIAHLNG